MRFQMPACRRSRNDAGQGRRYSRAQLGRLLYLRHAGGIEVVQVEPGNTGVLGRRRSETSGRDLNVITHVAEPEVGQERGTERVVESSCQTLISHVGVAGETADRGIRGKGCAAEVRPEKSRAGASVLLKAIAAKYGRLGTHGVIRAHVKTVRVEDVAAGPEVVVEQRVTGSRRWAWQQGQQRLRLRRQTASRDYVTGKLRARRRGEWRGLPVREYQIAMGRVRSLVRIENVLAQIAQVAAAFRRSRNSVRGRSANVASLSLVVAKEEHFVLLDRATDSGAELIPIAFWHGSRFGERIPCEITV